MNNMNQYIKNVVKRMYQIDVDTASKEQLEAIEEINVSDITMNSEVTTWNFSEFPNLKKIDCSYLGSPDKPGGLSIQLCKSEKKEFYIRYSS